MKPKLLPKTERKIARISGLRGRAEIRAIFHSLFGRSFGSTILFWNLLTFRCSPRISYHWFVPQPVLYYKDFESNLLYQRQLDPLFGLNDIGGNKQQNTLKRKAKKPYKHKRDHWEWKKRIANKDWHICNLWGYIVLSQMGWYPFWICML